MKQLRTLLLAALLMNSNYTWAASNNTTIDLSDGTTTSGTGWTLANNIFTITDGANVTVIGTNSSQRRLAVAANANVTVTLNNATITGLGENQSSLLLNASASVTLHLEGTNRLTGGGENSAAIRTTGATLIIDGAGSLTANGGNWGAGIGGNDGENGGTISISGGTVTANGGTYGAGIGGGNNGSGGTISINGGTVTATSGAGGAGIGGGYNGDGGTISISGGTVTANGGNITTSGSGAGIGGGYNGDGGTISISGGTVTATGRNGAGIGGGNNGGNGGTITISGGTVMAYSWFGAGIGGGGNATSELSSGNGGIITISGGTVTAININERADVVGGTGIGGGGGSYIDNGGNGGSITISGGTVKASGDSSHGVEDIGKSSSSGNSGTLTITGGSINAVNGNVGATPTNGSGETVSPNTLTLPGAANQDVTAGSINDVPCQTSSSPTSGYGIKDVETDDSGNLYLWLPAADADKDIELTANGNIYTGTAGSTSTLDLTYGITLSKTSTHTFSAATYGYGNQSSQALTVTVNNAGSQATGNLTVGLSGANASSFQLSTNSINSISMSGSANFTVSPIAGLAVGTYTATVTVAGGNITPHSFDVIFTVNKATPTAQHLTFTPTEATYDELTHEVNVAWADGVAGHGTVTATYYNGTTTAPSELGNYNISVDISEGDNYNAATGLTLNGTFSIKTNEEETTPTPPTPTPPTPTPPTPTPPTPTPPTPDTYLLNYTIPSDLIYDGNLHPVKVDQKSWVTGLGFPINVNYNGYTNNIPLTAGSYSVSVDIPQGDYYNTVTNLTLGNFQIFKKIPSTADFIYNLTNKIVHNGKIQPLKVTTLDTIKGIGNFNVLYDGINKAPSDTGTYQIVLNIDEGLNYTAADILLGNYIITTTQQTVQFDTITNDANINLDPNIIHYHDKGNDFTFILSPGKLNYGRKPVVNTNKPLQNPNSWIEIKINTDSTYIVTIHELTENIKININFTQTDGNDPYTPTEQVWSTGKYLCLLSTHNTNAYIYSIAGTLVQITTLQTNTLAKITLPTGFYVVTIGKHTYKILVTQ